MPKHDTRIAHCPIVNSILWDNWPRQIDIRSGPIVTYCDVERGWPGEGNIGVDPQFVDPNGPDNNPATWQDNDYHLMATSPCKDLP